MEFTLGNILWILLLCIIVLLLLRVKACISWSSCYLLLDINIALICLICEGSKLLLLLQGNGKKVFKFHLDPWFIKGILNLLIFLAYFSCRFTLFPSKHICKPVAPTFYCLISLDIWKFFVIFRSISDAYLLLNVLIHYI